MSGVEELKKYKELLDGGIITQEEFEKKKSEVLSGGIQKESPTDEIGDSDGKAQKKTLNKAVLKKALIAVGVLAVLVIVVFVGKNIAENNQNSKRAAALETEIASIMDDYGLNTYKVKYVDHSYEVYAVGFENLTNGKALSCLERLDAVSINDPCGDGKIDFGIMTHVHPGLDVEYSYWRVDSFTVALNETYGGNYKTAGIYCNQFGNTCIYECEN